jgi:hypothetical protein
MVSFPSVTLESVSELRVAFHLEIGEKELSHRDVGPLELAPGNSASPDANNRLDAWSHSFLNPNN